MIKKLADRYPLSIFFSLTFTITWGLGAATHIFADQLYDLFGAFGPGNPIFYISVYAPAISALIMIALLYGRKGLVAFLRRFLQWKIGWRWALIVFVGIPALYLISRIISHFVLETPLAYQSSPWYWVIPIALWELIYIPGALEEIGWRGFALPILQTRHSALKSSLYLGMAWSVWHLPAFFAVAFFQESGNLYQSPFSSYIPVRSQFS